MYIDVSFWFIMYFSLSYILRMHIKLSKICQVSGSA